MPDHKERPNCPMDPKALNNLDPKLKETYDRVMGTTPSAAPGAPTAAAPTTPATLAAAINPSTNLNGQSPPPVTPENTPQTTETAPPTVPSYTADNLKFQAAIQTPMIGTTPVAGLAPKPQGPSSLLRILYIVGAIVFFVVYGYFWAKIFNLPLPF